MKPAFSVPLFTAALGAASFIAPLPATAQVSVSTVELIEVCSRPGTAWVDFCNGYMQAANDIGAELSLVCIPPSTSRSAMTEQFQTFAASMIESQPQLADAAAINVVVASLNAVYPCAAPEAAAEAPAAPEPDPEPDPEAGTEPADQ